MACTHPHNGWCTHVSDNECPKGGDEVAPSPALDAEPLFTTTVLRHLAAVVAPHEQAAWAGNYGAPPSTEDDILRPALEALGIDPDMPFDEFERRSRSGK